MKLLLELTSCAEKITISWVKSWLKIVKNLWKYGKNSTKIAHKCKKSGQNVKKQVTVDLNDEKN